MNKPIYTHHVFVCQNERDVAHPLGCCASKGSVALLEALKAQARAQGLGASVRINKSGCLGQCEQGPVVVMYPQGIWHTKVSVEDVPAIIGTIAKEKS